MFYFVRLSMLAVGMIIFVTPGVRAMEGDAVNGKKVFKKCMSCHMVGEQAKHKVGPALNDLFGRVAGTLEGYKYGKSLVEAGIGGLVWNEAEVFSYLADPKKYLKAKLDNKKAKSRMSFKLKKDSERADVIAYLRGFSTTQSEAENEVESGAINQNSATASE